MVGAGDRNLDGTKKTSRVLLTKSKEKEKKTRLKKVKTGQNSGNKGKKQINQRKSEGLVGSSEHNSSSEGRSARREKKFGSRIGMVCGA